ncbi:MAG: YdcF family protein [Marinilabiliales bacterium]|nr:YdcF family protein [Marinilabiliales bacterium]
MKIKQLYNILIFSALLVVTLTSFGQPQSKYRFIRADSFVQRQNYYLLTLLEKLPDVKKELDSDPTLTALTRSRKAAIESALESCQDSFRCYLRAIRFSPEEVAVAGEILAKKCLPGSPLYKLVSDHLIPSGCYIRFASLPIPEMLRRVWETEAGAVNYAIEVYAGGKKPNSPDIDSICFNTREAIYPKILYTCAYLNKREEREEQLFFKPTLDFALRMIEFNDRNRIADFEPMEEGCNKAAIDRIKTLDWKKYPYSLILVPGQGPEVVGEALSAIGMIRCRIAVASWRQGLAPFLMVSGGRVHPYKTPFAEAEEMKKYMVRTLGVPENAILMEPHARHTTTNIRNCNRLIFRYSIPFEKPCLVSSDKFQSGYITSQGMQDRCKRELGYSPYRVGKRLTETEAEFFPDLNSLQIDSDEPMDP